MTRSDRPIERLVIRPPNWLGDAVLALPAMAAVREAFPGAWLAVAGPAAVTGLFQERTDVQPDEVIVLPASTGEAARLLAGGRFDLGVLFPNSFRSAWLFRRAGIAQRWGYGTAGRALLLTRRSRRPRRREARHMIEYYRALVRGLDVTVGDRVPRVDPSGASAAAGDALLERAGIGSGERFVACAPGAAYGQAKQWPPARMADVIARVAASGTPCALVGAPHDRPAARAIESWLRAHAPDALPLVADLVGRTSLGALVGVTARAAVFVSNDSGAMHLAAALGRPVVALFGPTDERATGPVGSHDVLFEPVFCRPCLLRDCPIDHRCMKRLSASRVASVVLARLETT